MWKPHGTFMETAWKPCGFSYVMISSHSEIHAECARSRIHVGIHAGFTGSRGQDSLRQSFGFQKRAVSVGVLSTTRTDRRRRRSTTVTTTERQRRRSTTTAGSSTIVAWGWLTVEFARKASVSAWAGRALAWARCSDARGAFPVEAARASRWNMACWEMKAKISILRSCHAAHLETCQLVDLPTRRPADLPTWDLPTF